MFPRKLQDKFCFSKATCHFVLCTKRWMMEVKIRKPNDVRLTNWALAVDKHLSEHFVPQNNLWVLNLIHFWILFQSYSPVSNSIIRNCTHNKIGQQYIITSTQTLLMYSRSIVNHTVNGLLIMSKLETGTEISEQVKSKHQKFKTSEGNRDFLVLEAKATRRRLLPKFHFQNITHSSHLPLLSLWIRKKPLAAVANFTHACV